MEKLERAAHDEIRSRVLLAVGHHLPAELAELTIEMALRIEEVPYRPKLVAQSQSKSPEVSDHQSREDRSRAMQAAYESYRRRRV